MQMCGSHAALNAHHCAGSSADLNCQEALCFVYGTRFGFGFSGSLCRWHHGRYELTTWTYLNKCTGLSGSLVLLTIFPFPNIVLMTWDIVFVQIALLANLMLRTVTLNLQDLFSSKVSIRRTAYCGQGRSWLHLQKVHERCLQENRFWRLRVTVRSTRWRARRGWTSWESPTTSTIAGRRSTGKKMDAINARMRVHSYSCLLPVHLCHR